MEKVFLGKVDLTGTSFEEETLATGYGAYIARPLLRKAYNPDLTLEQATKLIEDCLRILFYRDARSINKIQIAVASAEGLKITEPYSLSTYWEHSEHILSYGD
jgi:20S proteasome subunit beta 7